MNLQEQIGVLEAGVDQLLQAAAHSQRADERAAANPPASAGNAAHAARAVDGANAVEAPVTEANVEANVKANDGAASGTANDGGIENAAGNTTESAIESATAESTAAHTATQAPEATESPAMQDADAQPELRLARPSQNEITLTIGGQTVTLNALQVGQMVEELANARASMQPEPPPGIPPGWRFASTKNPVMAVQKQSNGDRLLVLRHTGHGWVPFTFSPDVVVQMYMMLTQR